MNGYHAGRVPEVACQLSDYHRARGWDARGRPAREKVEESGLAETVGDL